MTEYNVLWYNISAGDLMWSLGAAASISDFHSGGRGSIPLGTANFLWRDTSAGLEDPAHTRGVVGSSPTPATIPLSLSGFFLSK